MSALVLRRILVIALLVLISATLFVLLLPAVLAGIGTYAQHRAIAGIFLYPIWIIITSALSVTLTAGAFLLVALIVRRR